ncbi:MAG: PilZ domain-containing protein [Firmicutes bacterium]|nr:PilZ domain-containing protein [Alicyclobacillaceae bacterium]MCL6497626.1 PilZ domain-containing protein [Bacillota bacterium]
MAWQGGPRPRLRARVGVELGEGVHLSTRVLKHRWRGEWLDAPRAATGEVVDLAGVRGGRATLWWVEAAVRWAAPVRLEAVWDPVPIVEVRYLGPAAPAERRRAPRYRVQWAATWRLLDEPGGRDWPTLIEDLSREGARFRAAVPVSPERQVALAIAFPGRRVVRVVGRVVRCTPEADRWVVAVAFVRVPGVVPG